MVTAEKSIMVGLGEIKTASNPDEVLTCLGPGSCIGIAVYDEVRRVGGMAHIVLPDSTASASGAGNTKFADAAVPALLNEMKKLGAIPNKLVVKLAGGAHMAQPRVLSGQGTVMSIGERNAEATRLLLRAAGLRVSAEDVGGTSGRTVRLWVTTGIVTVSTAGQTPRQL